MMEFVFCQRISSGSVGEIVMAGCTAVGSIALASAGMVSPAGAVAACVPIIIPMTNSLIDAGIPISEDAKRSMTQMMGVNSAQLSFGLIEFLMGDIVNGFVHMVMAGAGFYVTRLDGIVLLPSYSVACTVFSGVSVLNMIDLLLSKGSVSQNLPLTANFVRIAAVCHPLLYVASAYYAWKLIEQLREGLLPGAVVNGVTVVGRPVGNAHVLAEPVNESRQPFAGRGFRLNQSDESPPIVQEPNT